MYTLCVSDRFKIYNKLKALYQQTELLNTQVLDDFILCSSLWSNRQQWFLVPISFCRCYKNYSGTLLNILGLEQKGKMWRAQLQKLVRLFHILQIMILCYDSAAPV